MYDTLPNMPFIVWNSINKNGNKGRRDCCGSHLKKILSFLGNTREDEVYVSIERQKILLIIS